MYRFSENRKLQAEGSQRAQFIQLSIPLEALGKDIALTLAQLGVRSQDDQIRSLLSSLGIAVNANAPAAASPSASTGSATRSRFGKRRMSRNAGTPPPPPAAPLPAKRLATGFPAHGHDMTPPMFWHMRPSGRTSAPPTAL